jgi:hypothetical protein
MDEDDLQVAHSNLEADRMSQILRWAGLIVAITIIVAAVVVARGGDILEQLADADRRSFFALPPCPLRSVALSYDQAGWHRTI